MTLVVEQGGRLFLVVYCGSLLFFCLFLVGFGQIGCFGRHLLLGRVGGCSLLSIVALGCFLLVFGWLWSVWLFWATLVVGQGGRCGD